MLRMRKQSRVGVAWTLTSLCCLVAWPATADDNLITNGDFEAPELVGGWVAPEHVILKLAEMEGAGTALRLEWKELGAFERWAAAGGLLKNVNDLLSAPLKRDTRYRLHCRLKVERFDVSREAEAFLKSLPDGQYDRPTIGVGCYGGNWNSGMPWMAYDMSRPGTWQELESEFVTPFTGSRGFGFLLDAYPHYRSPMKSSGVLYLDDVKLVFPVVARNRPRNGEMVFAARRQSNVGSTVDMYRIVSQHGGAIFGRDGYVIEAAISHEGRKPAEVAFEIRDWDGDEAQGRVLRYPRVKGPGETAATAFANEKGELRGGEYAVYAITDAANPRDRARVLSVKNVTDRVVANGRLGYPAALYRRGCSDKADAIISWSTNMSAQGFVEFGKDRSYGRRIEATDAVGKNDANVLRVILQDLDLGQQYHYRVGIHRGNGRETVFSDDHVLDTRQTAVAGIDYGEVRLTVISTGGRLPSRGKYPVTTGVPFPQGSLGSIENLHLVDDAGATAKAQFQPLAEWEDGSIRWMLVDFQHEADGGRRYTLRYGSTVKAPSIRSDLQVVEGADRIQVDTGSIQFTINRKDFELFEEVRVDARVVAGDGRVVMADEAGQEYRARRPDVVAVEELGPMRVCIRVAGTYENAAGEPFFDYEIRLHAFAGSSKVRVNHNYTCRLKERMDPAARGGVPVSPQAVRIRSMWMELPVRSRSGKKAIGGRFGKPGGGSFAAFGTDPTGTNANPEMRQITANRASIAGSESIDGAVLRRLPGWMEANGVAVGVPHFRELYPKAMSLRPDVDGVVFRIDTLPPIRAEDYLSQEGTIEDHVWGYLRGGRYRLRRGEGRSHDVWFDFDVPAEEADAIGADLTEPPVFAAATPEWYCGSGAIGAVQPRDERYADYDSAFTKSVGDMLRTREAEPRFDKRLGRYGLRNFGDNFGSDGPNWDNLEYDLGYSCLLQFMRSADIAALRMGREAALHNMNVDILKIRDGYHWPCGHQGDHSVQFAGLGHTWVEGLWTWYFLTGDRQAASKALGVANMVAHRTPYLTGAGAPGAGGSRDFSWSVVALMATHGATMDPTYLNAAREIEEVAVRTQHPFGGGWLHRLSPGHCFHAPAHSGRVYFMHEIVLAGQIRFFQATSDPDVAQCLKNAVSGILNEYNGHIARGLPGGGYTTCPFMEIPGPFRTAHTLNRKHSFQALRTWEPVYFVDALWPELGLHERIRTMLGDTGLPQFTGSLGAAKGFAQNTRWTPNRIYWILRSQHGGRL